MLEEKAKLKKTYSVIEYPKQATQASLDVDEPDLEAQKSEL